MDSRFRWMVAAAMALGAAGCRRPAPAPLSAFTFTVVFDERGCPTQANADAPNCESPPQRQDCVRVRKNAGAKVRIEAKDPAQGPEFDIEVTPAGLVFDPVGEGGKRKATYAARIDDAPPGEYKFSIVVPRCRPLDPVIIIQN